MARESEKSLNLHEIIPLATIGVTALDTSEPGPEGPRELLYFQNFLKGGQHWDTPSTSVAQRPPMLVA
jgi:hypothetical protein